MLEKAIKEAEKWTAELKKYQFKQKL